MIGAPSILRLTRKAAALARVLPTFDVYGKLKCFFSPLSFSFFHGGEVHARSRNNDEFGGVLQGLCFLCEVLSVFNDG